MGQNTAPWAHGKLYFNLFFANLLFVKFFLGSTADGAAPVIGKIFKFRSRIDVIVRVAVGRVIHITARSTYISVHNKLSLNIDDNLPIK
jgi:hypothetical protein